MWAVRRKVDRRADAVDLISLAWTRAAEVRPLMTSSTSVTWVATVASMPAKVLQAHATRASGSVNG
jgi:hypothetical protein